MSESREEKGKIDHLISGHYGDYEFLLSIVLQVQPYLLIELHTSKAFHAAS